LTFFDEKYYMYMVRICQARDLKRKCAMPLRGVQSSDTHRSEDKRTVRA